MKSGRNGGMIRILILCALLAIAGLILLEQNLSQTLLDMSYAQAYSIAVDTVNRAVRECIGDGVDYDRLIETTVDAAGRVTLMQTNAGAMNRLASETALRAEQELNSIENQSVSIPLGSALGVKFLAGMGPYIHPRIIPIGAVSTGFESTFESASGKRRTKRKLLRNLSRRWALI